MHVLNFSSWPRPGHPLNPGLSIMLHFSCHALPLGKLTSNLSFLMNMVRQSPNSQSKDCYYNDSVSWGGGGGFTFILSFS